MMMSGMMGGGFGMGGPGARVGWLPPAGVDGQPTDLSVLRTEINGGLPVWKGEYGMVLINAGVQASFFRTHAHIPDTDLEFPDELWNIRLGTSYMHRFGNGWTGSVGVGIGSASDQPFASLAEVNANLNAMLRIPRDERDAWIFFVFYSPNSEIPFPIPGLAYQWNPDDCFRMTLGLPFSLNWRPTPDWTFDLMYLPITRVRAQASFSFCPPFCAYLAYEWTNEGYFLAERSNDQEQLFGYEMRLTTGVRGQLGTHLTLDVFAAYVFDRFYFLGDGFGDRNQNRLDVQPGALVGLQAGWRF